MAKLGRYSADRKKIEDLTATKTVEVAECGTIFTLNSATEFTVTLPSVASAGKGWWCKFIVKAAPAAADYIVTAAGSDTIVGVIVTGADGAATDQAGTGQVEFKDGAAVEGDQLELVCDGVKWYVVGHCNAATGIDMGA